MNNANNVNKGTMSPISIVEVASHGLALGFKWIHIDNGNTTIWSEYPADGVNNCTPVQVMCTPDSIAGLDGWIELSNIRNHYLTALDVDASIDEILARHNEASGHKVARGMERVELGLNHTFIRLMHSLWKQLITDMKARTAYQYDIDDGLLLEIDLTRGPRISCTLMFSHDSDEHIHDVCHGSPVQGLVNNIVAATIIDKSILT